MNILFIVKVKIAMLIKWSYIPPTNVDYMTLEWFSYFEYSPISFKHMPF